FNSAVGACFRAATLATTVVWSRTCGPACPNKRAASVPADPLPLSCMPFLPICGDVCMHALPAAQVQCRSQVLWRPITRLLASNPEPQETSCQDFSNLVESLIATESGWIQRVHNPLEHWPSRSGGQGDNPGYRTGGSAGDVR